jgi:hypothetical protein
MVWPQNLVACTLLNTLHAEDEDDGIGMSLVTPPTDPSSSAPTSATTATAVPGDPNPAAVAQVERRGGKGMSRYKFFLIVLCGSFFFFFLPGYLFEALSVFSFVCWAAPENVPVNQLFGVHSGMGMGFLTFDWGQIAWTGSPLMGEC